MALGAGALRTRAHPDPARPARGRARHARRGAGRHAPGPRRSLARPRARRAPASTPWWPASAIDAALAQRGLPLDETDRAAFAALRETDALLAQDHEVPACSRALDGRFIAPGGRRRPPAQPGRPAHGAQPPRLRPLPPALRLRGRRRRAAGRPHPRPLPRRGRSAAREHRPGALGHRQPEERGRPDRPGAGADRRGAPLRRLRPPLRRDADPPGDPRPPAHRRGRHPVGHLPRSAAPADQAPGGSLLPRRHRRRAGGAELRPQARPRATRPSTASTSRPRRSGCSRTPRAPTAPTSTTLVESGRWEDEDEISETFSRRKSFAYGRTGQPAPSAP